MMKLDTESLSGRAALTALGMCLMLSSPQVSGADPLTRSDVTPASGETGHAKVIETATFAMG